MKFAKLLQEAIALSGDGEVFLDYKSLKKLLKPPALGADRRPFTSIPNNAEALALYPHAVAFFKALHKQVEAIDLHYAKQEESLAARYADLVGQFKSHSLACLGAAAAPGASAEAGANGTTQLLQAVLRFYTAALATENACVFNVAGAGKATKKFDKLNGTALKEPFMRTIITQKPWASYARLNAMLAGAEEMFKLLLGMLPASALQGKAPLKAEEAGRLRHLKEVQSSLQEETSRETGEAGHSASAAGEGASAHMSSHDDAPDGEEEGDDDEVVEAGDHRERVVGVKSPRAGDPLHKSGAHAASNGRQGASKRRRTAAPISDADASGAVWGEDPALGEDDGSGAGDSLLQLAAIVMSHDHTASAGHQ